MSTSKILFLSFIVLAFTTSCSKEWFTSYNGNMPTNERIANISLGMSKTEVQKEIGVPSNIASFDENTWIYMSSEVEQVAFMRPKEVARDILVLKFDKHEHIEEIKRLSKEDGMEVAVDTKRTASVGKKQGFFEKYFGGVGQYNPIGSSNQGMR